MDSSKVTLDYPLELVARALGRVGTPWSATKVPSNSPRAWRYRHPFREKRAPGWSS